MQCLEDKDIRVCKKKVFAQDEQQWVDASFYRFTFTAHEEKERREMIEWCKNTLGVAIVMEDGIVQEVTC